ncbi:IS3 family transposase [Kineosporia babensis]|uniref:IS3 family transposase n=1 Tax=Kineosporia babensis TaxID=499548 RepID=A0A9X1NPH4_9ACTN|nr:IS3 family transposase [Kineosporia babensis]
MVAANSSTQAACRLLGVARATHYRRQRPPVLGPPRAPGGGVQPAALSDGERARILHELDSDRFADKSASQAWAVLIDEGTYLGSISTFYRVLRDADQVIERRAQARHPPRTRPELVATGPDQVWSWDITKLKTATKGVYLDLYVVLDIYSRKVIHWEVHSTETRPLAAEFINHAIERNGGVMPHTVHSDNGTSMTSKDVADLLADLRVNRSLSRPHTSNDNPYSESAFKTLKYCPAFPEFFTGLGDAQIFLTIFFRYYNNEHRHSGIGLYTPASVHDGTWKDARDHRQKILNQAYDQHPERFRRRPTAPGLPAKTWINKPPSTIESDQDLHKTSAA